MKPLFWQTNIAGDTRVESPVLCYTDYGTLNDSIDNPGIALFLEGSEYFIEQSIIKAEQMRDSLIASILYKIDEIGVKDTVYIDDSDITLKAQSPVYNETGSPTYIDPQHVTSSYSYGPWSVSSRVGPLLAVEWGQREPFNASISKNCDSSGNAPVGCVAVATSYILTYWFNKNSLLLTLDGLSINSNLLCRYTWVPNRYDGAAPNNINGNTIEAAQARNQVARLMERIGSRIGMEYDCDKGSTASSGNAVKFLKNDLGFKGGSEIDYNFNDVKNSLDNGRPVMAGGFSTKTTTSFLGITIKTTYGGGHEWVMDGYLLRSRLVTVTVTTSTMSDALPVLKISSNDKSMLITTTVTSAYTDFYPYYIHNNWGWSNCANNGYYVAGSFDSQKGSDLGSNTKSGEDDKSGEDNNFQFKRDIIPNIYY